MSLPRPPHVVLVLLLLGAAAVWGPVQAYPAAAHDALLDIDPAQGAMLDVAPTQVVLTFSDEQLALGTGAAVSVTDAAGTEWVAGPAVVSGATVTQPLRVGQPAGDYTVRWRSVASDGHPVSGASSYGVVGPPESTPEPGAETGPPAPTSAAQPPDVGQTQAATQSDPGVADDGRPGGQLLPLVVAGVAAVGVAVAALLAARRRGDRA